MNTGAKRSINNTIFFIRHKKEEAQNSLHLQKPNPIFMNRRLLSVTVFLALMLTSLLAGRHNYHVTRNEITADLNQALALTLLEKKEPIVTQDTIRAYKAAPAYFGRTGTDCRVRRTVLPTPEESATEGNLFPHVRRGGQGISGWFDG